MAGFHDRVREAVAEGRYHIGIHADERLRGRRIRAWQVIGGVEGSRVLRERPKARPNPVVEVEQLLPDGTTVKAVWAYIRSVDVAKLVTVHFLDAR